MILKGWGHDFSFSFLFFFFFFWGGGGGGVWKISPKVGQGMEDISWGGGGEE